MFQKKFQIIIDTIKANNSLFANSGFVKDLKTGGGFKGITDEYKHYFYGYIRSEEDEDKYNFTQLDDYSCSTINVDFDFKLVFSIEGCVENFGTILMKQLNDINGVFVNGFSDETENIYKIETGKDLQSDYFIRQYTRVMSQSTRNQVPITMQRQFYLQIPTLQEQLKIADFLTAVDARIGQLNQKKALLEDYKKGVMQQLFSQAIRFKDDDESEYPDWEDRKLGEITKWASGGTPSKDQPAFWGGDIPWISAVSMHGRNYSESPLKLTVEGAKSGSRLAVKDSLLLLVRGSMLWNRIPVGIAACDVAFNQDVKALVTTDEIEVNYLLQWFIASENMLLHKVVGTGIGAGKLDTDEMKNLTVELP